MKHLLNNLSEEEKNAIREQHTGGMKVVTENFKKLINAKSGDVKPLVNEARPAVEPVLTDDSEDEKVGFFNFNEGQTGFTDSALINIIITDVSNWLRPSLSTIQKFQNSTEFPLPKFVKIYVRTSSTGTPDVNSRVAQDRMDFLKKICLSAFEKLGVRADVAFKLMTQSYESYTPSQIDSEFYDTTKVKPKASERLCFIVVEPITMAGKTNSEIGKIEGQLIDASSIINSWLVDNVDESEIVSGINKLKTYSDITDLNDAMINARMGTLESFLNDQLFDDLNAKYEIVSHLNGCARRSGKSDVAKLVNNFISIII